MKTAKDILQGFANKQKEVHLDYATVLQAMELYANQDKWIDVKEKLPEIAQRVLVCCKHGVFVGSYEDEGDWAVDTFSIFLSIVTHWQPLPEPTKV